MRKSTWLLRAIMLARFAVCLVFAARLGIEQPSSAAAFVSPFIWFATIDGFLALGMAAVAVTIPALHGTFILVAVVDGLLLLGAALTLRLAPGIPYNFVALLLYLGLAGVFALLVGLLKIFAARRLERRLGGNVLSGALGVAGLASILFGAGAFLLHPAPATVHWLLIAAALAEGFALFIAAVWPWSARSDTNSILQR